METSVKHRVIQFIEYENISVREFERVCGLSNGYVNGIVQTITDTKLSEVTGKKQIRRLYQSCFQRQRVFL